MHEKSTGLGATASPDLTWRKSTFSDDQGCVEVAPVDDGGMLVRDSKQNGAGPVLVFTEVEWAAFRAGVLAGEFDRAD